MNQSAHYPRESHFSITSTLSHTLIALAALWHAALPKQAVATTRSIEGIEKGLREKKIGTLLDVKDMQWEKMWERESYSNQLNFIIHMGKVENVIVTIQILSCRMHFLPA